MNMIIETDCGHDPDDAFTLCYLAAASVNIRAINVSPGDKDQLAFVRFLCKEFGLDIPIGFSKESVKYSAWGVHTDLLDSYKFPKDGKADGWGKDIIKDTFNKYPDSHFFVIGPPTSTGRFLEENNVKIDRLTMQGGFLSYDLHPYAKHRLEKFEGKMHVPTFNMNGDIPGTIAITKADIGERRFCGKNVCHNVLFNIDKMPLVPYEDCSRPGQLFWELAWMYLKKHPEKKFHDPVAAVCHLHPEVGTWIKGKVERFKGGWGTTLDDDGDHVLAELDHDKFWEHFRGFK